MGVDRVSAGNQKQLVSNLRSEFSRVYDGAPEGCYLAPGRVNLIGEHLDYNSGKCLPMALPHATYAAMSTRWDGLIRVTSLQQDRPWQGALADLGPGRVDGWPSYVAGVVWAIREQAHDVPGLDIVVDSRVPVGAGLSSSAALECSVAVGICDLLGVELTEAVRRDLVTACIRAETEVAGAPTGGMDQTVALGATAGHALLLDCRDWSTEQVPWDPTDLVLLVIDTRAEHQLTDGGYAARRADCEAAAKLLGVSSLREVDEPDAAMASIEEERVRRRARHVFTEMRRVELAVEELQRRDFTALGRTFHASHVSLRDDFEVSCDELDVAVAVSEDAGALGARMTGGGFGGSAIALVPSDRVDSASEAVAAAFSERGFTAPGFLVAEPSAGARRIR